MSVRTNLRTSTNLTRETMTLLHLIDKETCKILNILCRCTMDTSIDFIVFKILVDYEAMGSFRNFLWAIKENDDENRSRK